MPSGLRQAAEFLHDLLLVLQSRALNSKSPKVIKSIPVMVAANKLDLFTALPAPLVQKALEAEITDVRSTRSKGLLDSGIGIDDMDAGEEKDWLGDSGEGSFEFSQMEHFRIPVTVLGGNATGSEGSDVGSWWAWIGSNL